jgi:predicted nucleic acid-binding protein
VVRDIHQQQTLELEIDKGEASAIALSFESDPSLLILDDAKARKVAEKLHLRYTGTLGVILRSKQQGIVPSIRPLLEKIQQTNFRFSDKIFFEILSIAQES